jgi:hypothetical protein
VLSCTGEGLDRLDVRVGMVVVLLRVLRSITDTYGTTSYPLSDKERNAKMI